MPNKDSVQQSEEVQVPVQVPALYVTSQKIKYTVLQSVGVQHITIQQSTALLYTVLLY